MSGSGGVSVIVTIGRNVAGVPMSAARWDVFRRDTLEVLSYFSFGADGLRNDGRVSVFLSPVSPWGLEFEESAALFVFDSWPDNDLAPALAALAVEYGQNSIGLFAGAVSALVGADDVRPLTGLMSLSDLIGLN